MKTQVKQPQSVSHTIQSKTKAANQADMDTVLQKYAKTHVGATLAVAQREELDEELLQGKFSDTAQCEVSDDEELLQGKFSDTVQCEALDWEKEEEEPLQGKFSDTAQLAQEEKPNMTGIPSDMKAGFENMSGLSFDDVRIHYNSDKPAQLSALAYTQGNQVYIAPGQERHLGHELGHVVQQKEGRVRSDFSMGGFDINTCPTLEQEADLLGNETMRRKSDLESHQDTYSPPVVQGNFSWLLLTGSAGIVYLIYKLAKSCLRGDGNQSSQEEKTSEPEEIPKPDVLLTKTQVQTEKGGQVGDCLYTAIDRALGNQNSNEDHYRQIAATWLTGPITNDDRLIIGQVEDISAVVDVVVTPQAWAGTAGDLAPYVLAHALDIELTIIAPNNTVVYNTDGRRQVTVYYNAFHYTHEPTEAHLSMSNVHELPEPISTSSPDLLPEDQYTEERDVLKTLRNRLLYYDDKRANGLYDKIERAISSKDPRKALERLTPEVDKYLQSQKVLKELEKKKDKSTPPRELHNTFKKGYTGSSVTETIEKGGGKKKGRFVGDIEATHIHIVGNNTHLIVSGKRINIRNDGRGGYLTQNLVDAFEALIASNRNLSGYVDCLRWLCKELDYDHRPFMPS